MTKKLIYFCLNCEFHYALAYNSIKHSILFCPSCGIGNNQLREIDNIE